MGGITPQHDSVKTVILRPGVGRRTSRDISDLIAALGLFGQGFWVKAGERQVSLKYCGRASG